LENISEWFEFVLNRLDYFRDREEKLKMKLRRIYTDIDFSNLALMIYKKSPRKIDIVMNEKIIEDANKIQISGCDERFEFSLKNKIWFNFKLEDYFLEYFLNPDFVFEK
jgi:hypothetical protein